MNQHTIRAPFFEIGPKSYLYGQDVVDLAIAADKASEKYGVDIIFTTPIVPPPWTRPLPRPQAQRASCSIMWKSR